MKRERERERSLGLNNPHFLVIFSKSAIFHCLAKVNPSFAELGYGPIKYISIQLFIVHISLKWPVFFSLITQGIIPSASMQISWSLECMPL